jgi:hypothetical protein
MAGVAESQGAFLKGPNAFDGVKDVFVGVNFEGEFLKFGRRITFLAVDEEFERPEG